MPSDETPVLSVVVPSTHAQGLGDTATFKKLAADTREAGGELILVTGAVNGNLERRVAEHVRVLPRPGASVFELRAAGLNAARGRIVALTEDHTIAAPEWCAHTIAAHARHPVSDLIGGAVDNGTRRQLIDWASFIMTFASFLAPMSTAPSERAPPIANLSLKPRAIQGLELAPGEFEFEVLPTLIADGRVALDDALSVLHFQSHSIAGTLSAHFHNGRSTTGLPLRGLPWRERLDRVRPGRPAQLMREVRRGLEGKQLPRRARGSLPLVAVVCVAHALGEWTGAIAGPGRSPHRVD